MGIASVFEQSRVAELKGDGQVEPVYRFAVLALFREFATLFLQFQVQP